MQTRRKLSGSRLFWIGREEGWKKPRWWRCLRVMFEGDGDMVMSVFLSITKESERANQESIIAMAAAAAARLVKESRNR